MRQSNHTSTQFFIIDVQEKHFKTIHPTSSWGKRKTLKTQTTVDLPRFYPNCTYKENKKKIFRFFNFLLQQYLIFQEHLIYNKRGMHSEVIKINFFSQWKKALCLFWLLFSKRFGIRKNFKLLVPWCSPKCIMYYKV